MNTPAVCQRALAYLHGELAATMQEAYELAGGPCPPEALPRVVSQILDDLLELMTADVAHEVRELVSADVRSPRVSAFVASGGMFYSMN